MDRYDLDEVVAAPQSSAFESPLKEWRQKNQAGTLQKNDIIEFFQKEARKYYHFQYEYETDVTKPSLKCTFREAGAKEGIIDILLEFLLGSNPASVLEKLRLEGNVGTVCGKVFKNGEPTYSCRECGMDATCVLCVSCFKQSAHRFHKYRMSTSSGGGCCDCGDNEAWKKDHYCEEHLHDTENPPEATAITDAIKERCEIAFMAVLAFTRNFFEIEPNASNKCLDGDGDGDDYYCTVLYNDESHTFDQVIQTLTKIVKCRQKDASEIVSSIDREGRAVVKCDTFKECCALKLAIEKQSVAPNSAQPPNRANQSLRVSVLHIRAVACQQFSLQLLTWFQELLMAHRTFREIFARTIKQTEPSYSIKYILKNDVKLWKTARTCWHRLLISGMLMEYDNKMSLAIEFSRHYATIVQDFIRDDHDHSFSVLTLSVQLFTVPSIAHYLIGNENIFFKLLHTFYHESIQEHIKNKTLHFAKNVSSLTDLKRASCILCDLKYILSFKPDTWTKELREGFLEGGKQLLKLLNVMQGMEAVTRQTDQHIDYEPEWESAFNLHIKLASTISLVLEWCSSDREVLQKFYAMVISCTAANGFIVGPTKTTEEQTVAGHIANCLMYDVSSKPVSIHLPLSRLFAGVYLHLGAYGLTFDNAVACMKRTPEELIEPILCTQTMIAQVNAGMWRRNGYSLLHQLYYFRTVRFRTEMLDRDIAGLQIGAALIESNQYLIHILNKFNLLKWIRSDYEEQLVVSPTEDEFIRQLSMIDEFLELLIVIIGERYMPGVSNVTEEDRIKKEIIQFLCIKSYSHSELNRQLPDSNNDTILEEVIESVAVFKKPQRSDAKGVYVLKEELYDDYNMYFYHYNKEEKSKSEETQRQRRKNKGELVCCPPPRLPQLNEGFVSIANLLQCDVMMEIISTVLDRGLDLKARSFLENHLQKVLHLIGYGLQEEQSGHYAFLSFYERAQSHKLLAKLEELSRSPRVEAHRDFIIWTLKKFKDVELANNGKPLNVSGQTADGDGGAGETATSMAEGDDATISTLTSAEREKLVQQKEDRARLAAERRAAIMAQMQNAQKNFISCNAELFAIANANAVPHSSDGMAMEWQDESSLDNESEGAAAYASIACIGVDRRLQQPDEQSYKCILCFEDCAVTKDGATLVYSAFIQKSKVLPPDFIGAFGSQNNGGGGGGSSSSNNRHPASSVHTSSCGHVMHANCWQEYYNNEESKEQRRLQRSRAQSYSAAQNTDFQCPYCRCLSNTVLPLTSPLSKHSTPLVVHTGEPVFPIDLWIEVLKTFGYELHKVRQNEDDDMVYELPTWEAMLCNWNLIGDIALFEKIAQPIAKPELSPIWTTFVQHYIKSARQFTSSVPDNETERFQWMWHSCIYTIRTLEVYLRAIDKPFKNELSIRHKSCLSGLIRASCLYATHLKQNELDQLSEPVMRLLDQVFQQTGPSVIEWNCFGMMCSMLFMVPNLLFSTTPSKVVLINGSMMDYYTLKLFYLANLVKAIVLYEAPAMSADCSMEIDEDLAGQQDMKNMPAKLQQSVIEFYRKYNFAVRRQAAAKEAAKSATTSTTTSATETIEGEEEVVVEEEEQDATNAQPQEANTADASATAAEPEPLAAANNSDGAGSATSSGISLSDLQTIAGLFEYVKTEMREFLRCCCLFFHFVTDVEFPDQFALTGSDTFEAMCKYLGLAANLEVYFDNESSYATILESFASHPDIEKCDLLASESVKSVPPSGAAATDTALALLLPKKPNGEPFAVVPCSRPIPQLVTLPDDYSDLINSVSDFICPNNEREEMKTPTMCLVCGEIVCGQSYCCQPELDGRPVGACTYHAHLCSAEIGIFLRIRDCHIMYLGRNKGNFVVPPYLDEYGETDQGLRRGNPLRLCPTRYRKIHLNWLGHGMHEEIARYSDSLTSMPTQQWHHI